MITKVGTDILNINRIKSLKSDTREAFAERILTEYELAEYKNIMNKDRADTYLASHFSAKEAFSKAMGTGISQFVSFQDITVAHNNKNKPYLVFSDKLHHFLLEHKLISQDLSISHDGNIVLTFFVMLLEEDFDF